MPKDTGQAFPGMEKSLRENFLPRLFHGKSKTLPPIVGDLSMLPVKKSVMVLQNPVASVQENYTISLCESDELIGAIKG